ncbi:MAG TPA: sensor histidine kinase, partial [Actinomycetota bacterium]
FWRISRLTTFRVAVVLPSITLLAFLFASRGWEELQRSGRAMEALLWTLLISSVELLPVPAWKSVQVSIGFPLFMAVAFVYSPETAGVIAFLGASDPRELRREVGGLHGLFNRSQIAVAVFLASLIFHAIAGSVSDWPSLMPAALLAVLADYSVNAVLVSLDAGLMHHVPPGTVLRKLRIGNQWEFAFSYVGLGFLGVMLGRLLEVGWWAVAAFVMPLLLARQMFFRTRALEDATAELKDRETVLRALSNRMAEERHDERMQIAGYLHDDMAQLLFRMSLHVDILQKQLDAGDGTAAREELDAIRQNKETVSKMLRALIKDLRLSPLGRAGLSEALHTLAQNIEQDWSIPVRLHVADVDMAPPVQLLSYQLVREALTNAAKHAEATELAVTLEPTADGVRVRIADDGKGFDPEQGSPEGHFGLTLMRERATVAGGTFSIDSASGLGTKITAEFPTSWLSEEPANARAEPGAS